jgi:hypothetical protein
MLVLGSNSVIGDWHTMNGMDHLGFKSSQTTNEDDMQQYS